MVDKHYQKLSALRTRIQSWARVVDEIKPEGIPEIKLLANVDLTYAKIEDWNRGHIGAYINTVKGSLGASFLGHCWVAELQERGAMHYHVVIASDGKWPKIPDKSGQWKYGMSGIKKVENPFYLMKYTGKEHQKDYSKFPRGAHAWGMGFTDAERRDIYKLLRDARTGEDGLWAYLGSSVGKEYAEKVLMSGLRMRDKSMI